MNLERRFTGFLRKPFAQGQHTMNEIPVRSDQFTVDLFNEIWPVEIGVVVFWHVHAKVIAKRIWVVALKEGREPSCMLSGLRKLATCKHEILHGGNIGFECEFTWPWKSNGVVCRKPLVDLIETKDQRWPNNRMEWNVVFAKEIQMAWCLALFIDIPPSLPCIDSIRMILRVLLRPNPCTCGVALDCFKPNINALPTPLVTLKRNRYAPLQIPCYRPRP